MSGSEAAALIASAASVIIAGFAIWLSVVFYRMTSELSESTREAARGIGASVDRLEKVFDRLYSDTFSMVKDTMSDMRRSIWPEDPKMHAEGEEELTTKVDAKLDSLKEEVGRDISDILQKQSITDTAVASLRDELQGVVDRAVSQSRKVEADTKAESTRRGILEALRSRVPSAPALSAGQLYEGLERAIMPSSLVEELVRMRIDGLVAFEGSIAAPDTIITLRRDE